MDTAVGDATLDEIARFASQTRYLSLPEDVRHKASEILVDALGCLAGGHACRAAVVATDLFGGAGVGAGRGVVVGSPQSMSPDHAAFVNTSMIRYLDYNDQLISGHASDMIGALLAVSAVNPRAGGAELLSAIVVAYEVHARVVRTMNTQHTIDRAYSITIGAAAGVAALLDLDAEQTRHAVAIATTAGPMLRAARAGALSDFKGSVSATGTKLAVFAALLSSRGMTGPAGPFEKRHGVRELMAGEQGALTIGPFGDSWDVLKTCFKFFPVAYGMQPAIWAAITLRDQVGSMDDVKHVHLHSAPFAWFESGEEPERWDPRTRETADHSMPYAFARAFAVGTVDQAAYQPSAFRDPATLAFMQRISIEPDWTRGPKSSDVVGVRAELETTSGDRLTVTIDEPLGHYRNPMSRNDFEAKARKMLQAAVGPGVGAGAGADDIIRTIWSAESAATIGELLEPFRWAPAQS